jgi:hypothetical protein
VPPTEALLAEDPLWLTALKVVVIFTFLMTLFMISMEHRVLGACSTGRAPTGSGPSAPRRRAKDARCVGDGVAAQYHAFGRRR